MSRRTTVKRFGPLTLVALGMMLAAAPPAKADTEMEAQCFVLKPQGYTVRIMRIASDQMPGMQALFAKFRYQNTFQMLGTGIRTNSLTPPQKDIVISFVEGRTGDEYRLTALFDPATGSGPWTIYSDSGALVTGTLARLPCDQD